MECLSLTVFEIFNGECDAIVDIALIRPLNKGQGHSFWYQLSFLYSTYYSVSQKSDPPKRLALTSTNLHHIAHN